MVGPRVAGNTGCVDSLEDLREDGAWDKEVAWGAICLGLVE